MVKTEPQVVHEVANVVKQSKTPKVMDYALADLLEECRAARTNLRDTGDLLRWPSPQVQNIPSLEAVGLNSSIMMVIADFHCAKTQILKAPRINFLKAQVGPRPCKPKAWGGGFEIRFYL